MYKYPVIRKQVLPAIQETGTEAMETTIMTSSSSRKKFEKRMKQRVFTMYCYRMYCIYRIAHPDTRFDHKLIRLQKIAQAIQFQLAVASTLGGAYHLCHRPLPALAWALKQERLGRQLGCTSIVLRAYVFKAINLGVLGFVDISNRLMAWCLVQGRKEEFKELRQFIEASDVWLKAKLKEKFGGSNTVVKKEEEDKEEERDTAHGKE